MAQAWCQDRLTIEDAKALSVLWKQLTRGAATGLQLQTLILAELSVFGRLVGRELSPC